MLTCITNFQVFIVSDNVIKIYAEGGLGYSAHGLGTEVLHCLLVLTTLLNVTLCNIDQFLDVARVL
jgi:hypothetical protein